MRAPKERPIRIVASGFHQTSSGKTWTCIKAITMPTKPRTDPTERSIWRATITRTIPPTMTPTTLLWTIRFPRLRGGRKSPVCRWKPTQMTASAATIPIRRVSKPTQAANRWKTFTRPKRAGGGASAGGWGGQPAAPSIATATSLAGRGRLGWIDPLADLGLGGPLRFDDEVQVPEDDGDGLEQDRVHRHAPGSLELDRPLDLVEGRPPCQRHRYLAGGAAQVAGVLPDAHGLIALGHVVQRDDVAVLARHRHLAGQTDGGERRNDPAGHPVIGGDDRVHFVVGPGEGLLHVLLRDLGSPPVGILLADDLDVALLDRRAQDIQLAPVNEVGVGVGAAAFDEHVVPLRPDFEHLPRLHPADFAVVEGDVEDARRLDETVVADDRDLLGLGFVHGWEDGVLVPGQNDQRVHAAGDEPLDVRDLLLVGALGVGADVARARLRQRGLDRRLVNLPALLLEVGPAHTDGDRFLLRGNQA